MQRSTMHVRAIPRVLDDAEQVWRNVEAITVDGEWMTLHLEAFSNTRRLNLRIFRVMVTANTRKE